MRKFILTAMLAAAPFGACAQEPRATTGVDATDYFGLAKCIAYASVKGGVDGKSEVDPAYAVAIGAMAREYLFQAMALGFSEAEAQDSVVTELTRFNKIKVERGIEAVVEDAGAECSALADKVKVGSAE